MPDGRLLPHRGLVTEEFLRIGGFVLRVRADDATIPVASHGAIQRFRTSASPRVDVDISVRRGRAAVPDDARLVFDSGAVWKLFERGGEQWLACTSEFFGDAPYKVARFDDAFRRGEIILSEDLDPLEYPLDEVLIANLLGREGGVELHGCAVIDGGRGRVFVGQSGAGKTTTARLWQQLDGVEIPSDDRVIVRRGDDAIYELWGTPWHGEAELSSQEHAPVDAIFLLAQAPANAIRRLPDAEAVARLMTCAFPLFHRPSAMQWTVDFLGDLVQRVPVCELAFVPDRSAVELVRRWRV